ncbi:hypothetical protein PIB30_049679 [Stylosanthes scabra]|uniref:Putative plant transposon protein domain-containing protein n=1 Tax=Stylosanthes scabra TaxID=79078 RepID=A0ABU6WHQ9_9FABA|nr:hypothetical protein [Stylosanthes scabra]
MADRKRKGKAVSSSSEVPKFKTLFHEAHYKSKLSARKVLPELIIQVDEDIVDPCGLQIQQRKWERFTNPIQAVGHLMVKEFPLGNQTKKRGSHIPTQQWKANKDYRLEHVLEDLCIEGADWVRHKDGRLHYLRRADLEPMTKGWYDFVCRSILPTTNRSELTVERAVLIHSIIIGENINVKEIIANQIYKFVYKTDLSSSLPFPSIIEALCADAKVPAIKDDTLIPQEPPIMGVAMIRVREPRARNPRQARQEAPPQQQPPQEQPQLQQEFPLMRMHLGLFLASISL